MDDKQELPFLRDLPSIGQEMSRCLLAAGIDSPAELRRIGRVEAAARVSPYKRSGLVCRRALRALEGAIRGGRWHSISKQDRDALWQEHDGRSSRSS